MSTLPIFLSIAVSALCLDPCNGAGASPSATTDASGVATPTAAVNAYGQPIDANGQVTSVAQTPTTNPMVQGVAPQPGEIVYQNQQPVLAQPQINAYAPGPVTPQTQPTPPEANGGLGADYTGTGTGNGSTGVGTGTGFTGTGTTPIQPNQANGVQPGVMPNGAQQTPGAAGPNTGTVGAANGNTARVGTPIPTQTPVPQPRPMPVPRGLVK